MTFTTSLVPPRSADLQLGASLPHDPYIPDLGETGERQPGAVEAHSVSVARSERAPAAVLTHATRLTLVAPTESTVLSMGDGSEETWHQWKGAFVGVTIASKGDLWTGTRGVCITAGYVPEEADETGAKKDLHKAAKHGSEAIAWAEAVNSLLSAACLLISPTPPVSTITKGALSVVTTGLKTWGAVKASLDKDEELESGLLHLHGAKEVLVSTPGSLVTGATTSNVMMGGVFSEVVGGMSAEVKSAISAEVTAGFKAGLVGFCGAEVLSKFGVEVAATGGDVKVAGDCINLGEAEAVSSLWRKQVATSTVSSSATETVEMSVGEEDNANLTVDGGASEIVARTAEAFLSLLESKVLLRSPGARIELGPSKISMAAMTSPSGMATALRAAKKTADAGLEAAAQVKHQAIAAGMAFLGTLGGVAGSLLAAKGAPTAVGVVGGAFSGMANTAMATSALASWSYSKAVKAARTAFREGARVARKAQYTLDEAAAGLSPSKLDIAATGIELKAPIIDIKGESVTIDASVLLTLSSAASVSIKVGPAKIDILPAGITIDAGAGLVTLGNGAHKWNITAAGLVAA